MDGKYVPCHYGLFLIFKQDGKATDASVACQNVLKFAPVEDFPAEVDICRRHLGAGSL